MPSIQFQPPMACGTGFNEEFAVGSTPSHAMYRCRPQLCPFMLPPASQLWLNLKNRT